MRSLHSCRISLKKALDQEGLKDVIDRLYNLGNSKLVRSRHATACRKCGRVEAEIKRRESTTPKEPLVVPAGRDVTGLFFGSRAFEHHEEVRESVFQTANRSILTDVCFLICSTEALSLIFTTYRQILRNPTIFENNFGATTIEFSWLLIAELSQIRVTMSARRSQWQPLYCRRLSTN